MVITGALYNSVPMVELVITGTVLSAPTVEVVITGTVLSSMLELPKLVQHLAGYVEVFGTEVESDLTQS